VVARLWTTAVELVPAGLFWMRTMGSSRTDSNPEDADV
jgi:hypothetical protein